MQSYQYYGHSTYQDSDFDTIGVLIFCTPLLKKSLEPAWFVTFHELLQRITEPAKPSAGSVVCVFGRIVPISLKNNRYRDGW